MYKDTPEVIIGHLLIRRRYLEMEDVDVMAMYSQEQDTREVVAMER